MAYNKELCQTQSYISAFTAVLGFDAARLHCIGSIS
jgi:hypothetical protein